MGSEAETFARAADGFVVNLVTDRLSNLAIGAVGILAEFGFYQRAFRRGVERQFGSGVRSFDCIKHLKFLSFWLS